MKRNLIKKLICFSIIAASFTSLVPIYANAATWATDKIGNYYFYEDDNSYAVGWRNINGTIYYFNSSGIMQKGWIKYGNSWYYLDNNGALKTGWINYNGESYYSDSAGIMQTGILQINGQVYCFGNNGVMKKGSIIINGQFYTIGSDGAIVSDILPVPDKVFDSSNNCINQISSTDLSTINDPNSSKFNNPIVDQSEDGDYEEPARKFTVTFRDENGEELKTKKVKDGDTVKMYEPDDDSDEDREFVEWNTKKDGSGKSYDDDEKVKVKKDLTLYAIWDEVEEKTEVSGISISGDSEVEIGKTIQLKADIKPNSASNTKIKWSIVSSTDADAGSATINSDGVLEGVGIGKITVKAESSDGSNISDTKEITVVDTKILVNSITVSSEGNVTEVSGDDNLQLIANVLPENASNKEVKWKIVSGDNIASIDDDGLLKPTANGIVDVEAIAKDGSGVSGRIQITVKNYTIKPQSISVTVENNISQLVVGNTVQMKAKITPSDVSDTNVEWSVINNVNNTEGEATIDKNGLLTGLKKGTVTVKAKAGDKEGTRQITVRKDAENVKIESFDLSDQEKLSIDTNEEILKLKASFVDSNGNLDADVDTKTVTWSIKNSDGSTDNLAAEFYTSSSSSSEVKIVGKRNGEVIVTATADNYNKEPEVVGTIKIKVENQNIQVNNIELKKSDGDDIPSIVSSENNLEIVAKVTPDNASNKDVAWSVTTESGKKINYEVDSSDKNKIIIKPNDEYVGNLLIRATSTDNSNVYKEKTIEFAREAKKINFNTNPENVEISSGKSITITANAFNGLNGPIEVKEWKWNLKDSDTTANYTLESKSNNIIKIKGSYNSSANPNYDVIQKITLTATVVDKLGKTCTEDFVVYVKPAPESISVKSVSGIYEITNESDSSLQMSAQVKPDKADQSVTWKVSDSKIATIDNNGLLRPVSQSVSGTVDVTAISKQNTTIAGSCTVKINPQVKN